MGSISGQEDEFLSRHLFNRGKTCSLIESEKEYSIEEPERTFFPFFRFLYKRIGRNERQIVLDLGTPWSFKKELKIMKMIYRGKLFFVRL